MSHTNAIRFETSDPPRESDRALRQRLDELERQLEAVLAVVAPDGAEGNVKNLPANVSEYSMVRRIIRTRRARERHFDSRLFCDPAWDMLLELYAAHIAQQRLSVSSLCKACAIPLTTGLRWISRLEEAGLVQRRCDPLDGRRVFLEVSVNAQQAMSEYFKEPEISAVV